MDFLDFFENMGLGMAIVIGIVILLFLITLLRAVIPALLMGLGGLFVIIILIMVVGTIIYFIGKFSKGFIKNR